jgi:excisionase family DNA binding protein
MTDPKEFSVAEAVKETGYSRQRLYQMIESNQIALRRVKVREELRIPRSIVEELKARKAAQAQEAQP